MNQNVIVEVKTPATPDSLRDQLRLLNHGKSFPRILKMAGKAVRYDKMSVSTLAELCSK